MGMGVVGLGVLGLSLLLIVYSQMFGVEDQMSVNQVLTVVTGFSFGASSIALFARVGGGIYTKAADVGADLVGKVEAGIPEDHPLNPATIADNVGDNVGDVAGMGADLFESYVGSIVGTMVLGAAFMMPGFADNFDGLSAVLLPLVLAGVGIVMSFLGTFFVKVKEGGNPQKALNMGNWGSIILTAIASYFLVDYILPEGSMYLRGFEFDKMDVFYAIIVGLVVGTLMSIITEYYTAMGKRPVNSIVQQSSTGHATTVIGGLAVGEEKAEREDTCEMTACLLPADRPRYLMGVGTPLDVLEAVHRGVDMFDCIIPTQVAKRGSVFTSRGIVTIDEHGRESEDQVERDVQDAGTAHGLDGRGDLLGAMGSVHPVEHGGIK